MQLFLVVKSGADATDEAVAGFAFVRLLKADKKSPLPDKYAEDGETKLDVYYGVVESYALDPKLLGLGLSGVPLKPCVEWAFNKGVRQPFLLTEYPRREDEAVSDCIHYILSDIQYVAYCVTSA